MDPLDILGDLSKTKPAYQPVISAIRHSVIGYELLGRCYDGEKWISLGNFFRDPDVPDEFKIEVDQHLLEQAITDFLESNRKGLLFINRNARQLMLHDGEDLLTTLQLFEEKGFSMSRVVIEVTEHDFEEDFKALSHLLRYYKTYGIQIAVDHIGAKSSNIDRIRQLEPHLLKIDTNIIRRPNADSFQDIVYSLSMLARRIGAALLFENIEDDFQLHFAWKHGGRFYQGNFLAEPGFDFLAPNAVSVDIGEKVAKYITREKALIEQRLSLILAWEQKVKRLLPKWEGTKKVDAFIEKVTKQFDHESFRMFVCNNDGQQVSANFRKRNAHWMVEPEKKGSNWAFRPYFLENVMLMKTWNKGILSELYSDIETKETIRTFSFPLTDQHFLFIDMKYSYIYEHECLLI
ncbi:diguanylate phosphodiesterase [Thalassobacillus devorans]|uniref:Diguanylate phosphodiesterase n=1 Tax=Thalassobacillus devorans TaxID=279813 RepID=A0ABQ1NKP2_9BACI|nr:EAL domain-containing protein [Thalassobacillus devorans]NIK27620.1 EAL domain-containing protein (putative c-di-GMP-specific phosphodiesterase class I) [Thalassobacillus devorans]GGC79208.1 diguanylate phosphodiesterase [Thalassobacillus devorans]